MTDSVLVGTAKGLFVLRDGGVDGPFLKGHEVYATAFDHEGRILAAGHDEHWGPAVFRSDDGGKRWSELGAVRFPADVDAAVARVWQIQADPHGRLLLGVEPAALFTSTDDGASFELVRGLWDHPHRPQWQPGGGGLCLHTIVPDPADPQRLWVAVSAAGAYRTDDGGTTWQARSRGIATPFLPGDEPPEFGQCVHKMVLDPKVPDRLYLQHHWGVYRSDDAGDSWQSIGSALPSDFGFPVAVDPEGAVYVLPLESDEFRCTPEGRCRVYRSAAGDGAWTALADGLPQQEAYVTVLRDGFCAGPSGLHFGTRAGEVYSSTDAGGQWKLAAERLPAVLCVRA